MRPPHVLVPALALLSSAVQAAPPEQYVSREASFVVTAPSLEGLVREAAELLPLVGAFPGAERVADFRERIQDRYGFDLLDTAWMADAGIAPGRAAALAMYELEGNEDDVRLVLVLPSANPSRFEATVRRLMHGKVERAPRTRGERQIQVVRNGEGEMLLAYAIDDGTIVLALEADAVQRVRTALTLPRDAQLGAFAPYRSATDALGPGLAVSAFFSPVSSLAREEPVYAHGLAIGATGGAEKIRLSLAFPLAEQAPRLAAARVDARPLLRLLDPEAPVRLQSGLDLRTYLSREDLHGFLDQEKTSPAVNRFFDELLDTIDGSFALSLSVLPAPAGERVPTFEELPLAYLPVELVLGVSDPARLKKALRRVLREKAAGSFTDSEDGPWVITEGSMELGFAVDGRRLLVTYGPRGAMRALATRARGRSAPEPAAARTAGVELGSLQIDAAGLLEGLAAIPRKSYGKGRKATRDHRLLQAIAEAASRLEAVTGSVELAGTALHVELVAKLSAAQEEPEADGEAENEDEDE